MRGQERKPARRAAFGAASAGVANVIATFRAQPQSHPAKVFLPIAENKNPPENRDTRESRDQ